MTALSPTADLLQSIVRALVNTPSAAVVTETIGVQTVILEVTVAPGEMGHVIGRRGRTADALRELLVNWGAMNGTRYLLELVDSPSRHHDRA